MTYKILIRFVSSQGEKRRYGLYHIEAFQRRMGSNKWEYKRPFWMLNGIKTPMMINKENYELYAIDFIEGNLDKETRAEMLAFMEKHPGIKAEITELGDPIILEADTAIVYASKSELIRKPILWISQIRRYAAAAIILLAIGAIWIMNTDRLDGSENAIANNKTEITKKATTPRVTETDKQEINTTELNPDPIKNKIATITPTIIKPQNQINTNTVIQRNDKTNTTPIEIIEPQHLVQLSTNTEELLATNIEAPKEGMNETEKNYPTFKATSPMELISSLSFDVQTKQLNNNKSFPINLTADVLDNTKSSKKKGQWLINAVTKRSDGTKIFAFEGIKRALTPTRLRDAKVDNASSNDSPTKKCY